MELFKVITVARAKQLLEEHWPALSVDLVALEDSLGRVLAKDITCPGDVPPFDRSTVDGYAVRAADTFGASISLPAYLNLNGEVLMGKGAGMALSAGEAAAIPTGGMLPEGANAAVMVENTESVDNRTVAVLKPAAPGENLLTRGEDLRMGETILEKGRRLRPQDIALMAASGVNQAAVRSRLRIALVSTGNELVPQGQSLAPGQIYESNSYALWALASEDGALARRYGPVADDLELLLDTLSRALTDNDVVALSGGSSVGTLDLTRTVLERLGGQVLFHGIAIGPGKPTLAASLGDKLLIGLPGHPASAMVVYMILLSPLVSRGTHAGGLEGRVTARLTRSIASRSGREDYVMVRLSVEGGETLAEPVLGKSGLISPLVRAHGLAMIGLEEEGRAAGESVEVLTFGRY